MGAGVALATLWWAVPLLLLGRYSPPFLDYIESAAMTTGPTSLVETLRGDVGTGSPTWPGRTAPVLAGRLDRWSANPVVILDTVVVASLGLAALASPADPRSGCWLVLTAVAAAWRW